jgi:proteasome lid subunit RPN8/RPN11
VSSAAIILSAAIASQIESEGVAAYPNECCGILIGTDRPKTGRVIERIIPMKNTFDPVEQYHRFTIDPLALARADEDAAREGKAVVGFYHSHPDHPARPSEYDRTHVPPWSFYSHIIVAIEKAKPAAMTCWVMNEATEQFDEQQIVRSSGPPGSGGC